MSAGAVEWPAWWTAARSGQAQLTDSVKRVSEGVSGGESGIRTHEAFQPAGFQDQCIRPLCHLSKPVGDASPLVRVAHAEKCKVWARRQRFAGGEGRGGGAELYLRVGDLRHEAPIGILGG